MLSNHAQLGPDAENGNDSKTEFWSTLLIRSERELRERLVGFTFAAVLKRTAYSFNGTSTENSWFPVGVAQMDSWVSIMNEGEVHNQLKYLRFRIKDLGNRYILLTPLIISQPFSYRQMSTDLLVCPQH